MMANVRGRWLPLVLSYMAGGGAGRCYTGTASAAAGGHRVRSRGGKQEPALTCLLLRTTEDNQNIAEHQHPGPGQ